MLCGDKRVTEPQVPSLSMLNGSGDMKYEGAGLIRGVPAVSPPPLATLTRTLQARAVIPEDRGQRTELLHESLREAEFKAGGLSNRTAYVQPLAPHLRVQRRKGCWGEGRREEEREKRGRGGGREGRGGGGEGEGAELRPVERP